MKVPPPVKVAKVSPARGFYGSPEGIALPPSPLKQGPGAGSSNLGAHGVKATLGAIQLTLVNGIQ